MQLALYCLYYFFVVPTIISSKALSPLAITVKFVTFGNQQVLILTFQLFAILLTMV